MRCKPHFARCLFPALGAGLWLVVSSASAGEKIQFSGRDGTAGKSAPASQAKSKFEAPDFLGVSRFKKDPLNDFVPLAPTAPARNRNKDEEDREKDDGSPTRDSQDQGGNSRSRSENGERGGQFDSHKADGQRGMDDTTRERERRREDENSSSSTNRFSFDSTDNSKNDRFGSNATRDGKSANGRANQVGSTLQMPLNARNGLGAKPGFTGLNLGSRGDAAAPGGAYANPGGRTSVGGFGGTSLPSYMRRDEMPLLNRGAGNVGGNRQGLNPSGGSFSGALGGAPKTLNDFGSISGAGTAKQPSLPAPPPESPRFERKPAVLEIPKRAF